MELRILTSMMEKGGWKNSVSFSNNRYRVVFTAQRYLPRKEYCITRDELYKQLHNLLMWDFFSSVFVQGCSVVLNCRAVLWIFSHSWKKPHKKIFFLERGSAFKC